MLGRAWQTKNASTQQLISETQPMSRSGPFATQRRSQIKNAPVPV
jgi:hypothetical protein